MYDINVITSGTLHICESQEYGFCRTVIGSHDLCTWHILIFISMLCLKQNVKLWCEMHSCCSVLHWLSQLLQAMIFQLLQVYWKKFLVLKNKRAALLFFRQLLSPVIQVSRSTCHRSAGRWVISLSHSIWYCDSVWCHQFIVKVSVLPHVIFHQFTAISLWKSLQYRYANHFDIIRRVTAI